MKASIDERGVMQIEPETALESYALKKWSEDNVDHDGSGTMSTKSFIIDCSADNRQPASS